MPKKKVDAITGRRKTSRKPTVREELFGFNTKTGKANTAKKAFLRSLSPLDLQRRGRKSVLQSTAEELTKKKKKKEKKAKKK